MREKYRDRDITLFVSVIALTLIGSLILVGILAVAGSWFGARQVTYELAQKKALQVAVDWATYLQEILTELDRILSSGQMAEQNHAVLTYGRQAGPILGYQLYDDPQGEFVAVSMLDSVGEVHAEEYFSDIVRKREGT